MEISLKFAWASLIYLLIGSTIGMIMVVDSLPLTPSHAHVLLIGFVSMMIFGVGYHLLPVFAGTYLFSLRLAEIQFWLQNLGLSALRSHCLKGMQVTIIFVYNIARSIIPPKEVKK
jgi:hypothetical protein